jgi:hypothetical protein
MYKSDFINNNLFLNFLEAIKKIKSFQDMPNSDIETPIKIYLAGAAFRKKK